MMYILRTNTNNSSIRNHRHWMLARGLDPTKPVELNSYGGGYLILASDKSAYPALLSGSCFTPAPVLNKELDEYM